MYRQEREMLACPDCGNSKGNKTHKPTITTDDKITYYRRCGKCKRRFETYHTKLDPYKILDEIKRKTDDLRG
jgi:transcriptional regulator NrdR family protein